MNIRNSEDEMTTDPELPENHCVKAILALLMDMDGMTNCMALGILECCKSDIFEMMRLDGEDYPNYPDMEGN